MNDKRSTRVLVISTSPFFIVRGTPLRTKMMVEGLLENFQTDVLTYPVGEDILQGKIRIFRPKAKFYKKKSAGPSFSKILIDLMMLKEAFLLSKGYDVLFCEDSESAFIGSIVKLLRDKKIVSDFHNRLSDNLKVNGWGLLTPIARLAEVFMYSQSDFIITNNDLFRQSLRHRNTAVIYDTVSDKEADPNIRIPKKFIAYSGNSKPYQGVDILVGAFKKIRKKGLSLVLMGDMDEGIRNMVEGMENVVLTGPLSIEQTNYILRRSLINIIPKRTQDSLPQMKALHYLLNGVPIMASDVKSSKVFLKHKVNSYLTKPDPDAMAAGLEALLDDKVLYAKIKKNINATRYKQEVGAILNEIIHKI